MKTSNPGVADNSVGTVQLANLAVTMAKLASPHSDFNVLTASGNFTPAADGDYAYIAIGGGGGGAGAETAITNRTQWRMGGGAGAGGGIAFGVLSLLHATTYPYVIGAGGNGGGNAINGNPGGLTSFNGVTLAAGGAAGSRNLGSVTPESTNAGGDGHTGGGYGGGVGGNGTIAPSVGGNGSDATPNMGGGGGGGAGGANNGGATPMVGGSGGKGGSGILILWRI